MYPKKKKSTPNKKGLFNKTESSKLVYNPDPTPENTKSHHFSIKGRDKQQMMFKKNSGDKIAIKKITPLDFLNNKLIQKNPPQKIKFWIVNQ